MEGETEARYGLSLPVPWLHPVLSPSPSASNVPAVSPTLGKGLCSRGRGGGRQGRGHAGWVPQAALVFGDGSSANSP